MTFYYFFFSDASVSYTSVTPDDVFDEMSKNHEHLNLFYNFHKFNYFKLNVLCFVYHAQGVDKII